MSGERRKMNARLDGLIYRICLYAFGPPLSPFLTVVIARGPSSAVTSRMDH
jgi:hypothetical protein